ncbi:uncharacterized protein SCHCODRAFT_01106919 [Schizophyllum commune H4-8]|nr:uncharacterized protein SCHCODRAFT_01106919 [Schizophyllum commune H4-8]KAI5886153.1 hypothetical protein SCHCODRAFT_01106919 [Schizophyllum commune H4-8]
MRGAPRAKDATGQHILRLLARQGGARVREAARAQAIYEPSYLTRGNERALRGWRVPPLPLFIRVYPDDARGNAVGRKSTCAVVHGLADRPTAVGVAAAKTHTRYLPHAPCPCATDRISQEGKLCRYEADALRRRCRRSDPSAQKAGGHGQMSPRSFRRRNRGLSCICEILTSHAAFLAAPRTADGRGDYAAESRSRRGEAPPRQLTEATMLYPMPSSSPHAASRWTSDVRRMRLGRVDEFTDFHLLIAAFHATRGYKRLSTHEGRRDAAPPPLRGHPPSPHNPHALPNHKERTDIVEGGAKDVLTTRC